MANLVERQIGPGPVPVWDIQTASASQIDACCGLGRGVNLLDNAYWVSKQCIINQRGQSAYTVSGNSIDRWRVGSTGSIGSLTLGDNGITLSHPSGDSGLTDMIQRLLYIPDGVYTFSVLTADNVLLSVSGDFSEQVYTRLGNLRVLMHPNNGGYKSVQFQIIGGGTVRPLAAKLELGSVQTLAHKDGDIWVLNSPPPNYHQELEKCQKYYMRLLCHPISICYMSGYISGFRFPRMRATPSIDFKAQDPIGNVFNPVPQQITAEGVDYFKLDGASPGGPACVFSDIVLNSEL